MIRRLRPPDAEAYRTLRLQALHIDPDSFGATHAAEAALPLGAHAARLETSAVFAATRDGVPVALAGLRQETGKFAHKALLWGLWTAPEARGHGIATTLVEAATAHARTLPRVVQVHLTVLHRAPALALYRRLGFVEYGREPRAIRTTAGLEDELLMLLRLA